MYFVGIANAIDLADRFLPRLQALNCELQVELAWFYQIDPALTMVQ